MTAPEDIIEDIFGDSDVGWTDPDPDGQIDWEDGSV